MTTQSIAPTHTHPFASLAAPPYRYLGHTTETYQAVRGDPNCPIQPGASCDHCSTGIYEVFRFRGSDGRVFKVGSTCVDKAGDSNLKRVVAKDVAKHRKEVADARADRLIEKAVAALPSLREVFAAEPHPSEWAARAGKTRLDWIEWMMDNAGRKGKVEAAKVILHRASL